MLWFRQRVLWNNKTRFQLVSDALECCLNKQSHEHFNLDYKSRIMKYNEIGNIVRGAFLATLLWTYIIWLTSKCKRVLERVAY